MIGDHLLRELLFIGIALCCAILAASTSSMSLIAASLMKSSVLGAVPSAELTPVCSPTDCAKAAELKTVTSAAGKMNFSITAPLSSFGIDGADGQFRERIIGFLFLGERFVEQFDSVRIDLAQAGARCDCLSEIVAIRST
jgi:hypothetical protein